MAAMRDLRLSYGRVVPARFLRARYARSSGAGGQNVNKVATKVDLRLDLEALSALLGEDEMTLIREKLAARLDGSGRLHVVSSEHRSQAKNLEAALARMERILVRALARPRPRRPTHPSRASKRRRLDSKRQRSRLKRDRARPGRDE